MIKITGSTMMLSSKVVTPVKTGVQCFCNPLKSLDSGFHRNDDSWAFLTFDEFVNYGPMEKIFDEVIERTVRLRKQSFRSAYGVL